MDVWVVEHTKIYTGSRIEGFNVKFSVFMNEVKALAHAWELAKKYINKDIECDPYGEYASESTDGYEDWPDDSIRVIKKKLDKDSDIALELTTGA